MLLTVELESLKLKLLNVMAKLVGTVKTSNNTYLETQCEAKDFTSYESTALSHAAERISGTESSFGHDCKSSPLTNSPLGGFLKPELLSLHGMPAIAREYLQAPRVLRVAF